MSTDETAWMSLSEAARLIGVHFTTLRRWANQGQIDYLRTPGGKRKFQRKAVLEFIERHSKLAHTSLELARVSTEAITRTRHDLQERGVANQAWYRHLSDEQRLYFRGAGSKLVALMLQFCARNSNGQVFLDEARRIAEEYGRVCHATGMSLPECVQMFLFFRKPILDAVHETGSLHGIGDMDGKKLFDKMTLFLDDCMVAMVVKYSQLESNPNFIDR